MLGIFRMRCNEPVYRVTSKMLVDLLRLEFGVYPLCSNDLIGKVFLSPSGGLPPYAISSEDGLINLNTFGNLNVPIAIGNYIMSLSDSTNCSLRTLIRVMPPGTISP